MARGPSKSMNRWSLIVLIFLMLGFVILSGRLFYLQVVDHDFYQKQAIDYQTREATLSAKRGTIYDANMKVLAQSATVTTITLSPNDIKNEEQRDLIVRELSRILELDEDKVREMSRKNTYYVEVKKQVERTVADEVRQFARENELGCIGYVESSKRYYPYGNFLSHVLGFTGSDNQGLAGIEAYYDKYLQGKSGRLVKAKTAKNGDMPVDYETVYEAQDGYSLVLTVDEVVQHFLEKHLAAAVKEHSVANRGTGIVMNVKTGEILGMAVKDDYDPNQPFVIADEEVRKAIEEIEDDEERRSQLQTAQEHQWRNKAISDTYEPGSVFKIVTASAALEEKVVTPDSGFVCEGSIEVVERKIGCWRTSGHGPVSFMQGVKYSCNPVFITVGLRLGPSLFSQYFEAFGLTERTGIDLPGEAGSIYVSEERMGSVELASCSMGQSNSVTPIQMITAVATAINGGYLVQPHIVKQVLDSDGNIIESFDTHVKRQVISEETSATVSELLFHAVNDADGGGKNAYVRGYRIGGKSGTGEKLGKEEDLYVASFLGFAPADDPEIAVFIVLDEAHSYSIYGSVLAAPAVANIMGDVLPYLGIEPQYTEEEMEGLDVTVPDTIGISPNSAIARLNAENLKARIVGEGDRVLAQVPEAGQPLPTESTVILYTEENPEDIYGEVPDVQGLTIAQANQAMTNAGFNVRLSGITNHSQSVLCINQSLESGSKALKGTVITLEFRDSAGGE